VSTEPPPGDIAPMFERASEYEALLRQGTRLSGEDRLFFVHGRIADLVAHLPSAFRPRRVLDFGCGLGDASSRLGEVFPQAEVVGVDTATSALEWARTHHAGPRVSFGEVATLGTRGTFDLCYVNGVLHHVPPNRRAAMLDTIVGALAGGGLLALFENNPWNPGARMVMHRIPFDRDAVPISPPATRRLLEAAGLRCFAARSLFYFPRLLAVLRPLEPLLARLPFGAQYYVLARKPAAEG
jgi:SAM-dependent methyltransferase